MCSMAWWKLLLDFDIESHEVVQYVRKICNPGCNPPSEYGDVVRLRVVSVHSNGVCDDNPHQGLKTERYIWSNEAVV